MTPVQFSQTGLNKLTSDELLALEAWMGAYNKAAAEQAIEIYNDGHFIVWEDETHFKICNGQICISPP